MRFLETTIAGAFRVELESIQDDRGFFARSWCSRDFAEHGLESKLVQCNISYNERAGTLRGLHYQEHPYEEVKLVRCTRGALFDVIVDLRPTAPTFLQWYAVELNEWNRTMLYIPGGVAHGFQTLQDNTEVFYQMSEFYHPEHAHGIHWNDPTLEISWPLSTPIISSRDEALPFVAQVFEDSAG